MGERGKLKLSPLNFLTFFVSRQESRTDQTPFLSGDRTPGIYEDVRTSINAATPLFSFSPEKAEERHLLQSQRERRQARMSAFSIQLDEARAEWRRIARGAGVESIVARTMCMLVEKMK